MNTSLIEYYEKHRITNLGSIFDVLYLEFLYFSDFKQFQFIIFYYYLKQLDIPVNVQYSTPVAMSAYSLFNSTGSEQIKSYLSKHFNFSEIKEQWGKIENEVEMMSKRAELLEE